MIKQWGNPASPILANFVMNDIVTFVLDKIANEIPLVIIIIIILSIPRNMIWL